MRIIAGTNKGRTLSTPAWEGLRPTSDRVREALFNMLADTVDGAAVLDVCAGTGAVGLEALSRGARHVTFVESDARAVRLIAENAARCEAEKRCAIIRGTVPAILVGEVACGPFDIVLLDPPYAAPWVGEALSAAARHLTPGGVLVLEHASRLPAPSDPGLSLVRTRRAGDSALSTYRLVTVATEGSAGER